MTAQSQHDTDALLVESGGEERRPPHQSSARLLASVGVVIVGTLLVVALATGGGSHDAPTIAAQNFEGLNLVDARRPCHPGDEQSDDSPCDIVDDLELDKKTGKYVKTSTNSTDENEEVDAEPDFSKCSWGQQNCNETKCCNNPGMICYMQNEKTMYAQCKAACAKGPDLTHWDAELWTCDELGERSKGDGQCSAMGEDCSKTQCCQETNTQCYEKVEGWATCKSECQEDAPDLNDVDGHYWSCKKLGPWTRGSSPWVEEVCAKDGENCQTSQCCAAPGAQCYEQNADWAACRYDCSAGKDPARDWEPEWTCNEIGSRTPGAGPPPPSTVGTWVKDTCAWDGMDCSKSRCCVGMNKQCFEKDEDWAVCKEDCTAGMDPFDNNETWSCRPLGKRSFGLPTKGTPPIFCWSLFQTTTYEFDIMKLQLEKNAGIFQCDDFALLSTDEVTVVGKDADGNDLKTLKVEPAEITVSVDGTAGNAELFINCWNVIVQDGRWNNHAWTLKVDPDAVLIPDRTRQHLAPYVMENVYVVNCNKFPSSPNFPMMYGSLEIFSWRAMQTYANNMHLCMEDMAMMLPQWGEDYFMTHCLDHIGVGRISDFTSVGDGVCTGANCGDGAFGAFHPFKTADSWGECWDQAQR